MSEVKLEVGAEVFHGNSSYRIISILDLTHINARSLGSGAVRKFHISELSQSPNNPDKPIDIIPAKDLTTVPDEDWTKVHNKALLFSQILQLDDEMDRRPRLREVAKELGISEPTAYRQLQKYKNSNGNPLVLLRKPRDEKGRFDDEVESVIQEAISYYLSGIRPKITQVYTDLKDKIKALNKERLANNSSPLPTPHINTIRHRISRLSASEIAGQREGKKGKETYRPIISKFPAPTKPLEVVQMDHTPLDLIIVDDENRMDIGRPTITLAIDVYSRVVTGFYISLEKPNMLLTGACLTHSILDKKRWLLDHGVKGEWPVYGVMDIIHTDNGKEFHSNSLKRACDLYKINMVKRPSGTPRYGGHIERLFKTFNDAGIHTLPGTTKSNVQGRGEYQSEKNAAFTLFEFETWFTEFIVNVYHRQVHSEIGMTPLEKYTQGILGDGNNLGRGLPPRIEDPIKLKIDFLPYEERSVQKYGIQLFGIDYYHDVLRKWIKQPDKARKSVQKFIVRYDPRDISTIFFYDPDMEAYQIIPYKDTSHPAISLWELKELKRKAKELNPTKPVDEDAVFEARTRMKQITEQAKKETKHVRRMKQKESIRQKESIPSIAKKQQSTHVLNPSFEEFNDDEFDDISPFEDIEQ